MESRNWQRYGVCFSAVCQGTQRSPFAKATVRRSVPWRHGGDLLARARARKTWGSMRRNSGGLAGADFCNFLSGCALRFLLIDGIGVNYWRAVDLIFDGGAENRAEAFSRQPSAIRAVLRDVAHQRMVFGKNN